MNPSRFNLVTLALIVAVAREGSISGGAKAVNLAVAAASKRIADFESQIGLQIFYRRAHGVELTEAGRAIFHNVLNILENVEVLDRTIQEIGSGARSHVRIWANPAAISEALPDDLSAFIRTHRDVSVELEERDSTEIIKAVRENRADIGIFADTMASNGLQTFVYCDEELVVVAPASHPLSAKTSTTLAEVLEYDFVGLLSTTPLAARVDYESSRLGRAPNFKVQVRGVETMCRMIAAEMGIGVLPEAAARRHLAPMKLKAIAISEAWAKRSLFLGVRDHGALSRAARLLVAHLCGEAAVTQARTAAV